MATVLRMKARPDSSVNLPKDSGKVPPTAGKAGISAPAVRLSVGQGQRRDPVRGFLRLSVEANFAKRTSLTTKIVERPIAVKEAIMNARIDHPEPVYRKATARRKSPTGVGQINTIILPSADCR